MTRTATPAATPAPAAAAKRAAVPAGGSASTPVARAAATAAAAASHAAAAASTAAAAASTAANAAANAVGDAAAQSEPPVEAPLCDVANSAVRFESWGKHFAAYEELTTGELVPLGMDSQFVDENSAVVIRRITDAPEIRSANSEIRAEWDDPKGLDIDIVVLRPSPAARDGVCRVLVRTPGLQTTGGYDRAEREPPGCPPNYDYFTQPGPVGKNAQWRIPAGTFRHGDKVEIQFRGRIIGMEPNNVPTAAKFSVLGKPEQVDTFYVGQRTICGQPWAANFAVVDFGRIVPQQVRRGQWTVLDGLHGRGDTRFPIYLDFPQNTSPSLASGLFRDAIAITVTAVDKDGKTRDVALRKDIDQPTLTSPLDGDTVVIKVARKYKAAAGPSEITARTYSFTAVSGGLHAAASGENKATFGTTPAFLSVFRHDGKDPVYGFAQTFSYTATRRTVDPGFFDEFGFGVHVSVLARKSTANEDGTSDTPLSLGVGVHVSFGNNSIQLGGGWDLVNEKAYALIGVSIPELVTLIDGK